MADARLSRQNIEALTEATDAAARLSRQDVEVLAEATDVAARLSRQSIEVLQVHDPRPWAANAYFYENVGAAAEHTREGLAYWFENVGREPPGPEATQGNAYWYENVLVEVPVQARMARISTETIRLGEPLARAARVSTETVRLGDPIVRLARVVVEVLYSSQLPPVAKKPQGIRRMWMRR